MNENRLGGAIGEFFKQFGSESIIDCTKSPKKKSMTVVAIATALHNHRNSFMYYFPALAVVANGNDDATEPPPLSPFPLLAPPTWPGSCCVLEKATASYLNWISAKELTVRNGAFTRSQRLPRFLFYQVSVYQLQKWSYYGYYFFRKISPLLCVTSKSYSVWLDAR